MCANYSDIVTIVFLCFACFTAYIDTMHVHNNYYGRYFDGMLTSLFCREH